MAFAVLISGAIALGQQSPLRILRPAENAAYLRSEPVDLPMHVAQPMLVGPPHKKLDPKYDVSKIGNREVGKGLDFYSLEKEIALGRQLSHQIDSSVRLVTDPVVTEYVNRVAQRLVRNSDAKVPFTVKVVQDDEVNAYALPGGFFYVNTGLIMAADNEAGLAGVMAHEIAHVAARDATRNETRSDIMNLASIPLIFFGGPAAMFLRQAVDFAVPMSYLKFSRDAERQADLLGIEYDYASGYDPEEFVRLFEKLEVTEHKNKGAIAKAFSTHPMTSERIKRAQKEISEYLPARPDYIVDTSEFDQVRLRVAELTNRSKIDLGKVTPVLHNRESNDPPSKPAAKDEPKTDHPVLVDATGWEKK